MQFYKLVFAALVLLTSVPAMSASADAVLSIDSGDIVVLSPTSPGAFVFSGSPNFTYAQALEIALADSARAVAPQRCGDERCWLSYQLENGSSTPREVNLGNGSDLCEIWVIRPDRSVEPLKPIGVFGVQTSANGDPFTRLTLAANQRVTLLVHVSQGPIFGLGFSTDIVVSPIAHALNSMQLEVLVDGVLLGGLFILGLYTLLVGLIASERSYFWYSLYLFLMAISSTASGGGNLISYVFAPKNPLVGATLSEIAGGLMWIALILFSRKFLDTKRWFPRFDILWVIPAIFLIASLLLGFMNIHVWNTLAYLGDCMAAPVGVIAALLQLRRGYRSTRWFLVAQIILGLGMFVQTGFDFDLIARPAGLWSGLLAERTAWIASLIEAVFFSLALADQVKSLTETVKDQTIEHLREKETLITQQKEELILEVHQRTQQLQREKQKSDQLLLSVLPEVIAEELKLRGESKPRRYDNVSILFTDFRNFTTTVSALPPEQLVAELNEIFHQFDTILVHHGVEKIKTIGDSYMVASGLPQVDPEHAVRCTGAALDMLSFIRERNLDSAIKWGMRAGIHSGPVVAGIVGKTKFSFDVFGDTVNIASRMESNSEPGRLNVSAYTYHLIRNSFFGEYRGKLEVKGKGEIDMYFVVDTGEGSGT